MDDMYDMFRRLCEKRKSVRSFTGEPVLSGDIEKIRKIASTSPYASGRKNWDMLVVDDKRKIREIASCVRNVSEKTAENIKQDFVKTFVDYSKNFTAFEGAPVLILPVFRLARGFSFMLKEPDEDIAMWERDSYTKSISCVSMLILLAAESLGLGGCYMTGALIAEKEIAKILKIKKGQNIGAIIPIGHPERKTDGRDGG